jgi:hypothetical protein
MDPLPAHPRSSEASPLTTHAHLERISEPWALNKAFAIAIALVIAILFGSWAASSQYENLVLFGVWAAAAAVIVFVQDYWWSPVLVINALSFTTNVGGIPFGGMEVGLAILCLALPTKMAMKTLRKAEPPMNPSIFYWLLLGYVVLHAGIIIAYNHTEGVPLKNIVKAYYSAIAPLIFYGLVIRYCHIRTVRPTILALFGAIFVTVVISIFTVLLGFSIDFSEMHISFGWLTPNGADAILRYAALYLFIFCLAYWPAARNNFGRFGVAIGVLVSAFAVLISGGRLSIATAMLAGIFFAIVRGKLWLALPFIAFALAAATLINFKPDVINALPNTVQRGLAPLDLSGQANEDQGLESSDDWHRGLRQRSYDYWLSDLTSFYVGHGYKSWDPSLDQVDQMSAEDQYLRSELAIEMGLTENMFSSITNIFGIVGLVLYFGFLGHLGWVLLKGYRLSPKGSFSRALCEFSLVNLIVALVCCFLLGSVPGLTLFYWTIGVLAARPYITGKKSPTPAVGAPERPAFARPAYAMGGALPAPPRFRPGRV